MQCIMKKVLETIVLLETSVHEIQYPFQQINWLHKANGTWRQTNYNDGSERGFL